jgi:hypothetical protein
MDAAGISQLLSTCETSRLDPAKSAYEGQSGRAANIVRGPNLTDAVEKVLVDIGES